MDKIKLPILYIKLILILLAVILNNFFKNHYYTCLVHNSLSEFPYKKYLQIFKKIHPYSCA